MSEEIENAENGEANKINDAPSNEDSNESLNSSPSSSQTYKINFSKKTIIISVIVIIGLLASAIGISAYGDHQEKEKAKKAAAELKAKQLRKKYVASTKKDIAKYVGDRCFAFSGGSENYTKAVINKKTKLEKDWEEFTDKSKLTNTIFDCLTEENEKIASVYPSEIAAFISRECTLRASLSGTYTEQEISDTIQEYEPDSQWVKVKTKQAAVSEIAACIPVARANLIQNVYPAEVSAEVQRICGLNKDSSTADLDSMTNAVGYKSEWSTFTTKEHIGQQVMDCINSIKAEARNAMLNSCTQNYTVDQIVKDPDSLIGQCFIVQANITQFDSATGKCTFRANFDKNPHTYSYQYPENSLFSAVDAYSCPELDGVDNSDFVKIWAKSTGSYSYETTIGGTANVPSFDILNIEVTRKE